MDHSWHKPIDVRVNQFKAFYQRTNERPLLGFFVGSEYPLKRYPASRALPEGRPITHEDVAVETYVADCEALSAVHEACGGDFIWAATPFWGIPWLEAALGCDILADHATGSAYSKPPKGFTGPDAVPEFSPNNPWAVKLVEFITTFADAARGRWPLATTRMRGISDLLAALYGGDEAIFAMLERREEVKAVAERLTDFWIAWGRLQLDHIPPFHDGIGSFYYSMWAPAGTVWHQEDAAALLSPDLFAEFIEPCDRRIVDAFDGCIMHQHTTGYVPFEAYLEMSMTALEMHIDEGGPSAEELYPIHRRILDRAPLLIWGAMSEADLHWIFSKLPAEGLAINMAVQTPDQALDIWNRHA